MFLVLSHHIDMPRKLTEGPSLSGSSSGSHAGYMSWAIFVNLGFLSSGFHKSSMYRVLNASLVKALCLLLPSFKGGSGLAIYFDIARSSYMNSIMFARNGEQLVPIGTPVTCRYILLPTVTCRESSR